MSNPSNLPSHFSNFHWISILYLTTGLADVELTSEEVRFIEAKIVEWEEALNDARRRNGEDEIDVARHCLREAVDVVVEANENWDLLVKYIAQAAAELQSLDPDSKKIILQEMVETSHIDGQIHSNQIKLIKNVSSHWGLEVDFEDPNHGELVDSNFRATTEQAMARIAGETDAIMEEVDQVLEAFESGGAEAVAELGEGTSGGSENGASDENDPEQGIIFGADGFARWLLGLVAYRHSLISSTEDLRIVQARAYITGEQLSTEKGLMKIARPELQGEREAALNDTAAWAQYILDEVINDDLPELPFHLIVAGDESIRNALHIDPGHAGHWMFTGHIDQHGVHVVRVGETPGGDETIIVYPLKSELREIASHTAIPEGVLTGEMDASTWYAADASEDHDALQDSGDGTSDLEDFVESGEEDDDEDTDWGGQKYTATGLHMGKDGAWVMADLVLDSAGDVLDVIFSRLELGELPDLGDADEHFVVTDAPFRFAEELHEDGERESSKAADAAAGSGEASDAVIGANRWAKRQIVPFFEKHLFEEVYTSNDADLSEYGISKKSIDAIPFIESIREKYGTSPSNIQLACPEMAMLAVGEKRIKFQHARTSIAGTEERARVLSAKLEDRNIQILQGDWVFADIFELVSDAKKEEGLPQYDLLDALALALVARDWIVEDEKLVVSGKTGKVVSWNGRDFEFFAMPNTKKKVPPR